MLDRPTDSAMSPLAAAPPAAYDGLGGAGDLLILVGRVLMGQIFVVSGFGKLMGLSGFAASLAKNGVPAPDIVSVIAACVEFFGGVALVVGFMTRWAAVLMLVFTGVAAMVGHRYWEAAEPVFRRGQEINFYKNVTIIGGFLFLVVTGGGRFSIDGLLRRR